MPAKPKPPGKVRIYKPRKPMTRAERRAKELSKRRPATIGVRG